MVDWAKFYPNLRSTLTKRRQFFSAQDQKVVVHHRIADPQVLIRLLNRLLELVAGLTLVSGLTKVELQLEQRRPIGLAPLV